MSKGEFSVYHFDSQERLAGDPVIQDVDITKANEEAKLRTQMIAHRRKKGWKKLTEGINCIFDITDVRMGFIVIKNGTGKEYFNPESKSFTQPQQNFPDNDE